MYFLYAVIALIIVITAFILFAKIKIIFEYKKYPGEKLYTDIRVSYGFIKLDKLVSKSISKASEKKSDSSKNKDMTLIKKIKSYTQTFRILKTVYSKNRWFIRKRLLIDPLKFHLKFGFGDAAATGIMTGAINTMLYWMLSFLDRIGTVKNHYFEVVPVFESRGFASEARGSITLRMINILTIAVRLYLTYKKTIKTNK